MIWGRNHKRGAFVGKFKYTAGEKEINKVLKMNQDLSASVLEDNDMTSVRKAADSQIASSMELLQKLGYGEKISEMQEKIGKDKKTQKLSHRPKVEKWEEIAQQADNCLPKYVWTLEDILTEEEIKQTEKELDTINRQFSRQTTIVNKTDLSFLALATALQTMKMVLFTMLAPKMNYGESFDPEKRLNHNDKTIESAHRRANDNFRDRHLKHHETGHWINLLYQTVPYDITKGSREIGRNMGGRYHRMYTLGHDPVLGWLFGTANILTDCVTFNDFRTNRIRRVDPITGKNKMIITPERVSLEKMLKECYEEIKDDYLNLPAALFAQARHLKSDEFTKLGLPVPLLSSINENFANKLYRENYDALCLARDAKIVTGSFIISNLLDNIIILVHSFFRKENESEELYEIRTRKILLISNSIASSSNILAALILKNPKKLDLGGILNTVTHLFTDVRFIARIKQEYVENEIAARLQKEISEIDALMETI